MSEEAPKPKPPPGYPTHRLEPGFDAWIEEQQRRQQQHPPPPPERQQP